MYFVNPLSMWLSRRQLGSCTCFCIWSHVMWPPENSSALVRGEGEARPGPATSWCLESDLDLADGGCCLGPMRSAKARAPSERLPSGGIGVGGWAAGFSPEPALQHPSLVKRRSAMQGHIGPVADPWWCVSEALNAQVWCS